LVELCL